MSARALDAAQDRLIRALLELSDAVFEAQMKCEFLVVSPTALSRFDRLLVDAEEAIAKVRGSYERAMVRESQAQHVAALFGDRRLSARADSTNN